MPRRTHDFFAFPATAGTSSAATAPGTSSGATPSFGGDKVLSCGAPAKVVHSFSLSVASRLVVVPAAPFSTFTQPSSWVWVPFSNNGRRDEPPSSRGSVSSRRCPPNVCCAIPQSHDAMPWCVVVCVYVCVSRARDRFRVEGSNF